MRQLESALLYAQEQFELDPKWKIVLSNDSEEVEYYEDQAMIPEHEEGYTSVRAQIVLDNTDGFFEGKDYKGYKAQIFYGALTLDGIKYSPTSPLRVIAHEEAEDFEGESMDVVVLMCYGIPNMMREDRASESYYPRIDSETGEYTPTGSGDKTVKTLLTEILTSTHPAYTHCQPYEIVWGNVDSLMNEYKPRSGFRIYNNGRRFDACQRLLDFTECVMNYRTDGKLYIYKPTTTGTTYDSVFEVESGHEIFAKTFRETVVIPNYISIKSKEEDAESYSGIAKDQPSIDAMKNTALNDNGERRWYYRTTLDSNAQAAAIAAAIQARFKLNAEVGAAETSMKFGSEIFDYVKVVEADGESYRVGNIGALRRVCNPRTGKFSMRFSFGGWLKVGTLAASIDYVNEIHYHEEYKEDYYNYLYVEMLDVEYLSAITANMGLLTAGEIRIGSGILTPTGYATGGSQTTLEDSTASWEVNKYYGMEIRVICGGVAYTRVIASNTETEITFTQALPAGVEVSDGDSYYFGQLEVQAGDGYFLRGMGTGYATGGGKNYLTDSSKNWEEDEWVGRHLRIIKDGEWFQRNVTHNTSNKLYFATLPLWKPFTGFRLWADDTPMGYIAGYQDGVVQFYTGSDGKLYAGGGAIKLDIFGLSVYKSGGYPAESVRFYQDGEYVGAVRTIKGTDRNYLSIYATEGNDITLSPDAAGAGKVTINKALQIPWELE